jgi:hypothetical protein
MVFIACFFITWLFAAFVALIAFIAFAIAITQARELGQVYICVELLMAACRQCSSVV